MQWTKFWERLTLFALPHQSKLKTVVVCLEIHPKVHSHSNPNLNPNPVFINHVWKTSCKTIEFHWKKFPFDIRWRHNDKLFHGSIADHHCASLLSFKIMDFIPECHTYNQNQPIFFLLLLVVVFVLFSCLANFLMENKIESRQSMSAKVNSLY